MRSQSSGHPPRWMAVCTVACALLGAAVLAPGTADAQTETLISNTGQDDDASVGVGAGGSNNYGGLSQAFRTGTADDNYTITEVVLHSHQRQFFHSFMTAEIQGDSGGNPDGTTVADLTKPTVLGNVEGIGNLAFPVTGGGVALTRNTTYHMVLLYDSGQTTGTGFSWRTTESTSVDSGAATGWSIPGAGKRRSGGNWVALIGGNAASRFEIQVRGFEGTNNPATGELIIEAGGVRVSGRTAVIRPDDTLTANTDGIMDDDGLGTFSYQWFRAEDILPSSVEAATAISGATSKTYVLTDADDSNVLLVRISFTDVLGNSESVTSEPTPLVRDRSHVLGANGVYNGNPVGRPTIVGEIRVGGRARIDTSGITDPDGAISNTWSYEAYALEDRTRTTLPERSHMLNDTDVASIFDLTANLDRDNNDATFTIPSNFLGQRIFGAVQYDDDRGTAGDTYILTPLYGPVLAANVAATGNAAITIAPAGAAAEVGRTLTAGRGTIADTNGVPAEGEFTYQWVRVDADGTSNPVDITGATSRTYTLAADDVGHKIIVRITFTDDDETSETRPSPAFPASTGTTVAPSSRPSDTEASGDVTIRGGAAARVGVQLSANVSGIDDPVNGLTRPNWRYQWERADDAAGAGAADIPGETSNVYTPQAADAGKFLRVEVTFTDDDNYEGTKTSAWTSAVAAAVSTAAPNTPATGEVTVSGGTSAQAGVPLGVTNTIVDPVNGLTRPNWRYQWEQADDAAGSGAADIVGATSSTYTPRASDVGKFLRVVVRFTDDDGHTETRVSGWTSAVAPPPTTPDTPARGRVAVNGGASAQVGVQLSANTSGVTDPVNGLTRPNWRYQWKRADDNRGRAAADIVGATSITYTPQASDEGKFLRVAVMFTDDDGHPETQESIWTVAVRPAAPAAAENLPAVGALDINGGSAAQVGVQLTANPSDITDPNGLTSPNWRYQWKRADDASGRGAADIPGATFAAYTPVKDDENKFLGVSVIFTDDDGNEESITGTAWTRAVARRAGTPATGIVKIGNGTRARVDVVLTAVTSGIADPVNGLSAPNWRYQWKRADDRTGAAETDIPGATSVEYTPTRAGDHGKFLRVVVTFTDGDGYTETKTSAWTREVEKRANSAPAGAPAISGTVQSGQTLAASTSALSDVNGTSTAAFTHQWQRQDASSGWTNVGSASIAYTLTAADVGMRIRVRVSYVDDDGYLEFVASDATAPVTAAANTFATGAPTVTGTAKVGQSLSAAAGDIADANGLTRPGYAYQWQRGEPGATAAWSDIAGATASSYTLTAVDQGRKIRVKVAFTDDGGTIEERQSAAYPAGPDTVEPADVVDSGLVRSIFTIDGPAAAIIEPATGTAAMVFMVSLARTADQATASMTVDYVISGSAIEGRDFREHFGAKRIVFGPGISTRTVTVVVDSDIVAEPDGETVVVTLANPSRGAAVGTKSSATGVIIEPPTQISVLLDEEPEYTREDRTVRFDIALSSPAPVAGEVEWRLVVGGAGASTASARSVGGRAAEDCALGSVCAGTAVFQANRRTPTESSYVVFDSGLPEGTVLRLQVKPFEAAQGGNLPAGTVTAVQPSSRIASGEAETEPDGWVNIGKETFAAPNPRALVNAVSGIGRSVATNVVEGIWRRAEARRAGGLASRATLGGRTLDTQALSSGDAGRTVREVASLLGIEAAAPDRTTDVFDSSHGGGIDDYRVWAGIPDSGRLASQSSFALSFGDWMGAGPIAIWGEASAKGAESKPDEGSVVDSDTLDVMLGFDVPVGGETLYGLAFSNSSGESKYRGASSPAASGAIETSLRTIAPYVHWTAESGKELWGSFGIGEGTLTRSVDGGTAEADLAVQMIAGGARAGLQNYGERDLSLKADALLVRTKADAAPSPSGSTAELSADSIRARAAFVWTGNGEQRDSLALFHRIELGARLDGGEADEGAGVDFAGAFRFASLDKGYEVNAHVSTLLLHSQNGFKEVGMGLSLVFDPGVRELGTTLSLEPTWNVPRSGAAESMWGARDLGGYAASDAGAAMKARLGYGAGTLRDRALATLYGEAETGDEERRLRLGAELRGMAGPLERLSLDVYGEREEKRSSSPDSAVMLEGRLGF